MGPSAEEVGGYSSNGSSRSRSRGRPWSARKHRKGVSRKKWISKSRSEVELILRVCTVSDSGSEDLSMPYRRPKPMPFTPMITCFRYHQRAKLPPNDRVYEGNKDSKDHLSIFSAAAEQEEWPMLVWCKMFRQTLSGSARNWFDSLDPKSVDRYEELSNKFLEEFLQKKGMTKTRQRYMASSESQMKGFKHSWTVLRQKGLHQRETAADTIEVIRSPLWEKSAGSSTGGGENLNTRALETRRTLTRGTSAPVKQAQRGPSSAFLKENIDALRTMIKELDNR
nr:hypothetical protein [Tanacetum cinerariifolium]